MGVPAEHPGAPVAPYAVADGARRPGGHSGAMDQSAGLVEKVTRGCDLKLCQPFSRIQAT
jgi:hypothetical protein